jgi:hypothetical protein
VLRRYDGLLQVRLTPLGAWCLGRRPSWAPAPRERRGVLHVDADLAVSLLGDLDRADRLGLETWCETDGNGFRLTPAKLLAAAEQGRDLEELRSFLSSLCATPLPPAVDSLLRDVAARCVQVVDRGPARILECDDEMLANLIAHDVRTRKLCIRAGKRHVVVAEKSMEAFRRALREVGYLVKG